MTIKNLAYIYNLLVEQRYTLENSCDLLRKLLRQAEQDEAENLPALEEAYKKARKNFFEADEALREFEEKDWN